MNLRVHSRNEVINYETQFREWKIQVTMAINFISSKDSKETRTMHTKSDNIELMMVSETDEIINECFDSLLQKYQDGLEESMRRSKFITDSVDLLRYHLQKTSLKRSGSLILVKNKGVTINPKSKDNCCFKHSVVATEHWDEIDDHPERISNFKNFLKTTIEKILIFQQLQKTGKSLNKKIRQLLLYVPYNTKQTELAYKLKHNFKW